MSGHDEIAEMYETVTTRAARTLNVADRYGVEAGKPANLIVLDAATPHEALRLTPARLYVVKDGRIVAETAPSQSHIVRAGKREEVRFAPDIENDDGAVEGEG
jgi:cytosine deaminase